MPTVGSVGDDLACAVMTDPGQRSSLALGRAVRNARRLRLLNVLTLVVAVTVWAVLVVIAFVEWLPGLAVFATCVILAATPTATNAFIMATAYGKRASEASAAILVSTSIAFFTLTALLMYFRADLGL